MRTKFWFKSWKWFSLRRGFYCGLHFLPEGTSWQVTGQSVEEPMNHIKYIGFLIIQEVEWYAVCPLLILKGHFISTVSIVISILSFRTQPKITIKINITTFLFFNYNKQNVLMATMKAYPHTQTTTQHGVDEWKLPQTVHYQIKKPHETVKFFFNEHNRNQITHPLYAYRNLQCSICTIQI